MQQKRTNRMDSVALVGRAVDGFYADLRDAGERKDAVAFCDGFPLPFPLLRAMDVPYFYGDAYSALVAARHKEKPLQQVAEDRGFIVEVCSYTRNAMGCALYPEEERAQGHPLWQIPHPSFVLVTDPGCSMLVNWGDAERRQFNVPMFLIQLPHFWGDEDEGEAMEFTVKQLRECVTFLEDMLHRPFNWDRLSEIIADTKVATTIRKEAMEMCKVTPSPATFFDWASALGGVNYLLGKPQCRELYQAIKDEVVQRVQKKEGAVIGEKYRLYWDGIMCWPKLGVLGDKFASLGACVVAGRYTHLGFYNLPEAMDPTKPLESLAANGMALHANHNLDWLVDNISNLCQEYNIDGIVCHAHRTCRPLAAPQLEIMDGVSRRLGIPAVFFEADMADETFYADAQVDTRIQALLEEIDARRKGR
ncbi:MAG: 2-hydroxyacyl-CoA dehydratase family protein [Dehalococcoidia bacterium]|nr:2-hydroxyacyl-CoA dehydratase family protein [Dehalococcoidia bacterium]MDP6509650.1 2-hydroxyacyl-CoA dehydratase family protein [Dehalococcoidia bacterium]